MSYSILKHIVYKPLRRPFPGKPILLLLLSLYCSFGAAAQRDVEARLSSIPDTGSIMKTIRSLRLTVKDKPDSALPLLTGTLQRSREINYQYGIGMSLLYIGNAWLAKSNYNECLHYYRNALFYLAQTEQGKKKLSRTVGNIGIVYQNQGDYQQALKYFHIAAEIQTVISPEENADFFYLNISSALLHLGQPLENILFYLDKAEVLSLKYNTFENLSKIYNNKGFAYNNARNWDSCLHYFNLAYGVAKQHDLKQEQYTALLNLGVTYTDMNQSNRALPCLLQAKVVKPYLPPYDRNFLERALGRAYMSAGQYRSAEESLLQALNGAEELGEKNTRLQCHHSLTNLYGTIGRYKEAYNHAKQYIALSDTVISDEVKKQTLQLEAQYRTAQKDKELAERKLFINAQQHRIEAKNRWIAGSSIVAAVLMLLLIMLRSYYKQKQKLQDQNMQQLRQQQEIDVLKARIDAEEKERARTARDLHDGIGGLVSALSLNLQLLKKEDGSLVYQDAFLNAQRILGNMSSEIKKTAYNLTPNALLQHDLPDAILLFCEQIKKGRHTEIDVQNYGPFETLRYEYRLTAYRIVQELLHNAIKHSGASRILVQMVLQERSLTITVEDNGIGYDAASVRKGMGLRNIEERVQSLSGHISVESAASFGTTTTIEFETDA